ncbi:putative Se/S carrier-like protein [Ruminococcus flavefaciens]|uniref:putative Se/S carrier-like protein n=1 Tax=Ruminococcus flavefaciens TaxID=1265 RepID=UPI00138B075A|nr:putative Se/S carrier-like protein [Ruminococcus flavefaciens]
MTISILDMPSYTYAVKAQRLLRSRGYPCRIRRREKSSDRGCGYSVHITGSSESPARLLESYNIPYSVISGGGEGDDQL